LFVLDLFVLDLFVLDLFVLDLFVLDLFVLAVFLLPAAPSLRARGAARQLSAPLARAVLTAQRCLRRGARSQAQGFL
jgi:hypothetical protein